MPVLDCQNVSFQPSTAYRLPDGDMHRRYGLCARGVFVDAPVSGVQRPLPRGGLAACLQVACHDRAHSTKSEGRLGSRPAGGRERLGGHSPLPRGACSAGAGAGGWGPHAFDSPLRRAEVCSRIRPRPKPRERARAVRSAAPPWENLLPCWPSRPGFVTGADRRRCCTQRCCGSAAKQQSSVRTLGVCAWVWVEGRGMARPEVTYLSTYEQPILCPIYE